MKEVRIMVFNVKLMVLGLILAINFCSVVDGMQPVAVEGDGTDKQVVEETICSICSTDEEQKIAGRELSCGHKLCTLCLVQLYVSKRVEFGSNSRNDTLANPPCPYCRAPIFEENEQSYFYLMIIRRHAQYRSLLRQAKIARSDGLKRLRENDLEFIEDEFLTEEDYEEALALQHHFDARRRRHRHSFNDESD